ncbi:uncharacterized protein T551_00607 [Pneumocystis jirovecii RU7]|uniref:Uncharacterized protein n=1 Tax=Pneumocystis jirovecii (strain RU7) TaxID=1408657 RepID=A0A0W4ZUC5_PNEJ7|nr:uncharacterized protein T551_00607 [Pneumocystis jirovecii RU7]KTW31924.1 hypothetical protein T551_00607 [Pneumocystis jirovecii RU7]
MRKIYGSILEATCTKILISVQKLSDEHNDDTSSTDSEKSETSKNTIIANLTVAIPIEIYTGTDIIITHVTTVTKMLLRYVLHINMLYFSESTSTNSDDLLSPDLPLESIKLLSLDRPSDESNESTNAKSNESLESEDSDKLNESDKSVESNKRDKSSKLVNLSESEKLS